MRMFRLPQISQRLNNLIPTYMPIMSSVKNFHVSAAEPETQFHEVEDETSGKVRRLAYKKLDGPRPYGLIYIPGFMAHKAGNKPTALHSFSQKYGFPFVRYDPSGLGESTGITQIEARMSSWIQDATEILLKVTDGPQIVIASSMGCWMSSIIAKKHPEKFASIVMLAPALNFGDPYEKVLLEQLPPKARTAYENGGTVPFYAPDYGKFSLCKMQFDDMRQFNINFTQDSVPFTCPVRIIHGIKDKDVSYKASLPLLHSIQTEDVHLTYLKHAGHTLTDESSLEVIYDTILKLASTENPKGN